MNSNNKEKTKAISKVNTRLSRHYRDHEISTIQLLKNASNQLLKNASCNILWGEGKMGISDRKGRDCSSVIQHRGWERATLIRGEMSAQLKGSAH